MLSVDTIWCVHKGSSTRTCTHTHADIRARGELFPSICYIYRQHQILTKCTHACTCVYRKWRIRDGRFATTATNSSCVGCWEANHLHYLQTRVYLNHSLGSVQCQGNTPCTWVLDKVPAKVQIILSAENMPFVHLCQSPQLAVIENTASCIGSAFRILKQYQRKPSAEL